jgi:hypothetical protein
VKERPPASYVDLPVYGQPMRLGRSVDAELRLEIAGVHADNLDVFRADKYGTLTGRGSARLAGGRAADAESTLAGFVRVTASAALPLLSHLPSPQGVEQSPFPGGSETAIPTFRAWVTTESGRSK